MNLAISLQAERASLGSLKIDTLAGKARVTADAMTLEPVSFGLFGGKYEGTLALSLAATPEFRLNAKLAGVDMAAATAFAGNPNTITGRLAGQIELTGRGMDAPGVLKTTRGTARIDITDGTVKNLGLVQTIVVATSGRADAKARRRLARRTVLPSRRDAEHLRRLRQHARSEVRVEGSAAGRGRRDEARWQRHQPARTECSSPMSSHSKPDAISFDIRRTRDA